MAKRTKTEDTESVSGSVWMPFSLHVPSGAGGVAAPESETEAGLAVEEAWFEDAGIGFSQELPPDQRTIPATRFDTRVTTAGRTNQPEPPGFCIDTRADRRADFKADPPKTGDRRATAG